MRLFHIQNKKIKFQQKFQAILEKYFSVNFAYDFLFRLKIMDHECYSDSLSVIERNVRLC